MGLSFESLTPAEEQWSREQVHHAREFVGAHAAELAAGPFTLEALDQAFANYLASEADPNEANAVVLAVGVAFGAMLVDNLGFEWCIATDDYGTDIAVRARPKRDDVTIYPTDFVAKRYQRREASFLVASFAEIGQHLEQIAAEWGDPR